MPHLHLRHDLDAHALHQITELLDETTELEGHAPIGEHKMAHLTVGAKDWDGILAYSSPHADDEHSTSAEDRLIGYAHLRWNAAGADPRLAVEVVVHPHHREEGIQARLLDATRTTVARAGGGRMFLWVHRVTKPEDTLAHAMGFDVQRQLAYMRREVEPIPDVADPPDGVVIRTYRGPEDNRAFLEVNNAAFEGHPENGGWSAEELEHRRGFPWFDPAGLFMAFRQNPDGSEGEPLGFHWTKWHSHPDEEPHPPLGEVYVLAVHPRTQGLGLGRLLLRTGIRHLATRSDSIVLYVDCASTGPVALYESEGFETQYREVCFVDDVEAARATTRALLRPAG
ncbi:mycothiol synthase [Euzebya tangerina]|uniref:mycothiol synthase n=1 Tax=Euzebya tangerina TaxID=591198 RepID=UPI0013C2BFA6|nr:mycothiol synthase [Euzebya tangerina]